MNEKEELIRFVEHIVKNGSGYNTEKSLKELRDIMVRNGASAEIAQWLDGMIVASPEISRLGKKTNGHGLSEDEIAAAIREGRERIDRMNQMRC